MHHSPLPAVTFLSEMTVSMAAYFLGSHGQNTWEVTSPLVLCQNPLRSQSRLHPSLLRHTRSFIVHHSTTSRSCLTRASWPKPMLRLTEHCVICHMCHDLVSNNAIHDFFTPHVSTTHAYSSTDFSWFLHVKGGDMWCCPLLWECSDSCSC